MHVEEIEIDLNSEFGPPEARALIEKVGLMPAFGFMAYAHQYVHMVSAWERRRAWWRPWKLRGIKRNEQAGCDETQRRFKLLHEVARAMRSEECDG